MQSPYQQDNKIKPAKSQAFVNPRRSTAKVIGALARRLEVNRTQSQKAWTELRRDINHSEHQAKYLVLLRRCDRLQKALYSMLENISPNQ